MVRGQTHETSGLGAAIVTAKGLGLYNTFREAADQMAIVETIFQPDPINAALYRQLYQKVYRKIYTALEPLYREIRTITGYPV
jgi:sugar (pentulose or hexulose) kinase